MNELSDKIKSYISGNPLGYDFHMLTMEVFRYQAQKVPVYRDYLRLLGIDISKVDSIEKIPFLPATLFKSHAIHSVDIIPTLQVVSSGTTGAVTSRHYVSDPSMYELSFMNGFRIFYGNPDQWVILALLPSYLERKGSSLVYMADRLIRESKNPESGFYLNEYNELHKVLHQLHQQKRKIGRAHV